MNKEAKIVVVFFVSLSLCATAHADELLVPAEYPTIQAAIDAAVDGDFVIVADGIYTGEGNRDIDFLGKAITVRSESGPESCIIDCNGNKGDPHRGFYFHSGEQENSVVDGFTITNAYGGAISCIESSPTISNCIITGNNSGLRSGGITCRGSYTKITNCTITKNELCGIFCDYSSPTITNCTISGNRAKGDTGGGGIYCWGSSSVITNCNIAENQNSGIAVDGGSLTVANCTITGNSREHPGGGGIDSYTSELTIDNSTITGNSAAWGGGVCVKRAVRNLIITNCTISDNTAKGIEGEYAYGGGIICIQSWDMDEDEPFTFSNCTISGNIAETGGAICNYDSILAVANCILWDDRATHGPEIAIMNPANWSSSLSIAYSDVQGGPDDIHVEPDCTLNWALGNIDTDPCFIKPGYWDANNLWVDGDYHLLPDSPCIDAGDPNYIAEPNETDLDGNPRLSGDAIDMGAYETIIHEARLLILPRVINRKSSNPRIMAWVHLPQGITKDQIDSDTLLILYPGGIKAMRQFVLQNRRRNTQRVSVFAAFDKAELMDAIPANGRVELQVLGHLRKPGQYFHASDTIRIIPCRASRAFKKLF